MKRTFAVLLALLLLAGVVLLPSCTGDKNAETAVAVSGTAPEGTAFEIALITGISGIDDKAFNSGAWAGVTSYAEAQSISHTYYTPASETTAEYIKSIDTAVTAGAKVIILPGSLFSAAAYEAESKYPNVKFILLDGTPAAADGSNSEALVNTAGIIYSEAEAGYLAGYAAVKDGYTHLGFLGGTPLPSIQAFLYGYAQGAEVAARELKLSDGAVTLTYRYAGNFDETDANKALAVSMYESGAEVIFACGGAVGKSVIAAAEEKNGKVIGVDVDMRSYSKTVITSAVKELSATVRMLLAAIYETNTFETYGGKTTYFNAANGGIGLPVSVEGDKAGGAFDRFKSFDKAAYDEVYKKLADGTVKPVNSVVTGDAGGNASPEEIVSGLSLVKLTVTKG